MTNAERRARDRAILCHEIAREFVNDIGPEYDARFRAFRSYLIGAAPSQPTRGQVREIASRAGIPASQRPGGDASTPKPRRNSPLSALALMTAAVLRGVMRRASRAGKAA